MANTINIEQTGYILSNLFASANQIQIKGVVYNVYSVCNNLTIDGFVCRDVKSICDTLNINSMIGRHVSVSCSSINFKEKPNTENPPSITSYGSIQGNLTYSSNEEIAIPEDYVSGETHFTKLTNTSPDISDYIYSLGTLLASTIVLWFIGLWISPKLLHNSNRSITLQKALQIIGLGILVPIVLTLLFIILLLIPIVSQISLLLLCLLAILFFVSTSVAIININSIICNKLKTTNNLHKLGFLIVIATIYWILVLIPYVDILVSLIAIIWGIGNISYSILIKEKNVEQSENSDKKISASKESNKKVESKSEKETKSDEEKNESQENKPDEEKNESDET